MADHRWILMIVMVMAATVITICDGNIISFLTARAGNCCSECIQCPGPHGSCIRRTDLCNDVKDCQHGEDENNGFCESYKDPSCRNGQVNCGSRGCTVWKGVCNMNQDGRYCPEKANSVPCQAFNVGQLPSTLTPSLEPPKSTVDMEQVSEYLLARNCSRTDAHKTTKCPMLYTDVAGTCLAALPFELSWPAAQQVCQSIAGRLLEFKDVLSFTKIVQHLINTDLASNFWIGGFFHQNEDAWSWSSGSKMPSSTPYWTLKYNSTCQSRKSFTGLGPVPGCFHYQQAPLTFKAGHCAALLYRYLYYISDEPCFETRRPLCVPEIIENQTIVNFLTRQERIKLRHLQLL